jgi:AmmeMemoRadiSam system protein B
MDFPKLRYLEAFPVNSQGEKFICLRDPLKMTDKIVFLALPVYFIVTMFDGNHSIRDIQAAYMRHFGQLLYTEKIQDLISQLDANLFLESQKYLAHKSHLEKEFQNASKRLPIHAGTSYSADPEELRTKLDQHFEEMRKERGLRSSLASQSPKAIIAPHIDLRVGATCYAWAYEQIKDADFDLFVVFGTAHAQTNHLFVATFKDFETPLGTVRTNRPLLENLKEKCGNHLFEDEFVHKQEHSIEFQMVFLKYLFTNGKGFEVLPILCGSFHQIIHERKSPHTVEEFQQFVDHLQELLAKSRLRTCLIAGADLAHIGLRFGDPLPPDDLELAKLKQEDEVKLKYVAKLDKQGFWESIARDHDRRRICGFPCIYTMLSLLQGKEGRVLKYGVMDDRNTGSAVSYASMVFH